MPLKVYSQFRVYSFCYDYALGVTALFRVKRIYLSWYSQKNKKGVRAIDLFSLYVLFSQYRSCDNTLENYFFLITSCLLDI